MPWRPVASSASVRYSSAHFDGSVVGTRNMKCRACKAPLKETPTVTTPTCPYCGAYWPGGLGGLWIIGASLVAYVLFRLFVEPG